MSFIDPPWSGIFPKSFNFESLKKIAQAIVVFFQKQEKELPVNLLVASDGSSLIKRFIQVLTRIIVNSGSKLTIIAIPIPISTFSFAIRSCRLNGGIYMACDPDRDKLCRILLFDAKGKLAPPSMTALITHNYSQKQQEIPYLQAYSDLEKISEIDPRMDYQNALLEQINHKIFHGKRAKIIIDHFFGTSRDLFENLLSTIGLDPICLNRSTIFSLPGKQSALSRKSLINLKKTVNEKDGLLGVAIDSHCQKAFFYQKNRFFSTDELFPVLLDYLYAHRQIKASVVCTLNDSLLIDRVSQFFKQPVVRSAASPKFVSLELEDCLHCFAGFERSSGLIWKKISAYPDGLLFTLLVIEMILYYQQSLEKILKSFYKKFPKSYYREMIVENGEKPAINFNRLLNNEISFENCQSREIIDGLRLNFSDGWLLIRKLGLKNCYQIAAEAVSRAGLSRLINLGVNYLEKGK